MPGNQHPATLGKRARQEDIAPWQMLHYYHIQPYQGHSPKTGKRGQHYHVGKESSILGYIRHVWSWVRELNPKKTKPCGCTYTSTSQAEGSPQAGRHLIPGECPR